MSYRVFNVRNNVKLLTIFELSLKADVFWNPDLNECWFWLKGFVLCVVHTGLKVLGKFESCWKENDGKLSLLSLIDFSCF